MLENILNLEGVAVLSRKQQKNLSGGGWDICKITEIDPNGNSTTHYIATDAANPSDAGNQDCVNHLQGSPPGSRCFYDCEFDGPG